MDYALAIAPFLAVIVAIGVAVVQAYLQRQHLKHNLFEKRYTVWNVTQQFLLKASVGEHLDVQSTLHFRYETEAHRYLFGAEVHTFMEGLYEAATEILQDDVTIMELAKQNKNVTDLQNAVTDKVQRLTSVFVLADAEFLFQPYLQLYYDANWLRRLKQSLDRWMQSADKTMASRYRQT
jgi:hypothetical protein